MPSPHVAWLEASLEEYSTSNSYEMFKSTAALRLKIAFCSAFDIFRIVSNTEQQHKSLCPKCGKYSQKMEGELFRS